jgi:hypothetical protein
MINSIIRESIKALLGLNVYFYLLVKDKGLNVNRVIYEDKKHKVKL